MPPTVRRTAAEDLPAVFRLRFTRARMPRRERWQRRRASEPCVDQGISCRIRVGTNTPVNTPKKSGKGWRFVREPEPSSSSGSSARAIAAKPQGHSRSARDGVGRMSTSFTLHSHRGTRRESRVGCRRRARTPRGGARDVRRPSTDISTCVGRGRPVIDLDPSGGATYRGVDLPPRRWRARRAG